MYLRIFVCIHVMGEEPYFTKVEIVYFLKFFTLQRVSQDMYAMFQVFEPSC